MRKIYLDHNATTPVQKEVLDVMRNLASDGMTMIVVSHEMGFAREVADWMVMMDEGQIIEGRSPGEFLFLLGQGFLGSRICY